MNPSGSTIASAAIGIPAATVLSWILHNAIPGLEIPAPVEAAMGVLIGASVGYFFNGGRHEDTV